MALVAGLPGTLVALALLWVGDYTTRLQWTLTCVILLFWASFSFAVREAVAHPLRALSNFLAALREGDYSMRARGARSDDALGLAMLEVNALGKTLREQRLGALEATVLLRRVMAEIDAAVFAFDAERRLRLVNRGGERLLGQPAERLLGRTASALGISGCLEGDSPRTLDVEFPGASGRWEIRLSEFRQGGLPHQLLVLIDVSKTLRDHERQAWQRLVRVLGHEINNSLAPIQSLAGSLQSLLLREARPADLEDDLRQGLAVIAGRAEALGRFMTSYARLARLPRPRLEPLAVEHWVRRLVELETRLDVEVLPGPPVQVRADGDQLEQLLINVLGNAVDAALETGGGVRVGWSAADGHLELRIEDDGPGISDTANLFVPFFTTKASGSGIGLALSRQIAEAHGGTLTLESRRAGRGAEAKLRLPL
ncbi:MAG: PAS domain-containing sensor histidine kinase [Gemmatimonadetes bacterium]|nr:PAS domain-containing sensor histidine kinase [Gemmatimonadota bacterium]